MRRHLRGACHGLVIILAVIPAAFVSADELLPTPTPQAVEAMRLLESSDPYQRQLGFLRLEALRETGTVKTIERYLTSRDPEVRAYSLRAVAAITGEPAIPTLLQVLASEKHPRVRRAALLGLEPFERSDPRILAACIKALRDPNTEVRMAAVDIVSRVDDPRAREAILIRYKRETRRDVRRVLRLAMKRLGQ